MSARNSSSCKICCFCNLAEDNELEYGKIHEYNGIVTHYYCLLLSSNMEQKGNDDEGILGFLTEDIQKELRRGKRLVCSYCKKIGATLGCCNIKCKRIFHFPCGLKAGSLHQYFGEFRSYCINHRPKQRIDEHILKQISSLDNILCCICYDKINPTDYVKTLWAPCCKKNAFFHRKCVQQLALSAGYFFKCPLCNNKQDFRNAMLEYGIFIPSQDASWELVPNAFEELLYRHNQCDAVKCLCPKGRKHVSSNAKWELTLCRTCGSQGIHMACGQLKWANPIWECTECTSILNNSKNNEDAESDNSSDDLSRDSDLDSNSSTDISVGMEFPVSCASPSFSSSSSTTSLDFGTDVRMRPGPRSFKMQQQMIKWMELNGFGLTHDAVEKDVTAEVNQNTNTSSKNDDKEKSLRNNENNNQKERRMSSNDITSQPIQKETDVITIESDDDNEVEIITLKSRTNRLAPLQSTSRSNIPHVSSSKEIIKSQLNTVKNSTSTCSNATSTNLLKKDNNELHKSIASKQKISNKSDSTISELSDVAILQKSPDIFISNNDLDNLDAENISKSPIMNIKITNVTSLPPEVFESVPDVALHENSTSSPSTSKSLEKLVSYIAPPKRIYEEANNVVSNCKKIKGDFDEKSWEKNSIQLTHLLDIVTTNTSKQQNEKISPTNINEIHKNNFLKCTTELLNESSNLYNDIIKHTSQVAENYSGNVASFNVQNNENSVKARKTYLPSSKRKNQLYLPLENPTSMPDPNVTINQDVEINGNMLHSLSNILPNDFTKIIQPTIVSRPVEAKFNAMPANAVPVVGNDNQTKMLDEKNTALMKEKIFTNVSNPDDNFSNNIFCDGDAGTCPAEINSTGRKKTDPSSQSCGSEDSSNAIESHNPVANNSVFPRVTNNYSTCHQPRLIPQYMNLHDLKFRVCKPDNVQMVLYDTFSVNIPIKNSKENKIRSANLAAQRESKELSYHASGDASSSAEYIDDIQTAEQRFKLFRSLKNENLIHDKIKYIVHDQDDTKENLDPVRSKMLSRNDTFDNSLVNDICDTMTVHDSFCDETDNEMYLVSSDTNLSTLNPTICNKNVKDSVMDGVTFVSNDRKQTLQVNWEDVQKHKQISIYDMTPAFTEEKIARSFCTETNRIVHNVDFDFNIVKMNKNTEKILQDDITVSTNRHNNRKIGNDYTDDSQTMLRNSYKHLDNTNVIKPKVVNWSATHVSNIMFNERILNRQIDTSGSLKFIRCLAFNENTVSNENNFRHNNSESFLKVSIDLCKIQNLIDSKPELFVNQKCNR